MKFAERSKPTNLLLAFACLLAFVAVAHAKAAKWKVFAHRAGWSITYPADWKIVGCRNCSDPTAPDRYADFVGPDLDTDSGWVRVDRLEDKPSDLAPDAWFDKEKAGMNLNPRLDQAPVTVGGLPGLKVLYSNSADGAQIEQVFILSGSETFSVAFSSTKAGARLTELPNYAIYHQMLESFRVK